MKKIFLVPVLAIFVSSCTLFGTKDDVSFSGLYKANIHASINTLDEFGVFLGINRHENIAGAIHTALNVPGIFSGSVTSNYEGLIDGRNSEGYFRDIRALFTSLVSSGSLSVDEIGLVSYDSESFLSYKNLNDDGLIPDELKTIIKKYEGSWLNVIGQTNDAMSNQELMGYSIGKNLFTKSLADVEKYATDYPIWKDTADLGMSGSLHIWAVDLDRSHILELVKKLSLDLTGTGVTDEYAQAIENNLATVSFSGKLGFDPANPKISLLDGTISASGKLIAEVFISKDENGGMIRMSNSDTKTVFTLNFGNKAGIYTFDAIVKQADIEQGKITGYIEKKDGKFRELSFEASAKGITITLKHTVDGDKFFGKLSAVVGTLEWSGSTGDNTLKSLVINGTAPFGNMSVNLTEGKDGMAHGPVSVKSGQETLFSANLGLAITREKFGILLDVLSESMPAHFELNITGKATPSSKKVTVPISTKSFQDLIKDMDAIAPVSAFTETHDDDFVPANITSDTMPSDMMPDIQ